MRTAGSTSETSAVREFEFEEEVVMDTNQAYETVKMLSASRSQPSVYRSLGAEHHRRICLRKPLI